MERASSEASAPDAFEPLGSRRSRAPGDVDRALVYEYLCQLSELREVHLLSEERFLARRAEVLGLI